MLKYKIQKKNVLINFNQNDDATKCNTKQTKND